MDHEQRERVRRAFRLAAVPIEFRGSSELHTLLRECTGGCTGAGPQEIRDYLRPPSASHISFSRANR